MHTKAGTSVIGGIGEKPMYITAAGNGSGEREQKGYVLYRFCYGIAEIYGVLEVRILNCSVLLCSKSQGYNNNNV